MKGNLIEERRNRIQKQCSSNYDGNNDDDDDGNDDDGDDDGDDGDDGDDDGDDGDVCLAAAEVKFTAG